MIAKFLQKLLQTQEEKRFKSLAKGVKLGKGVVLKIREDADLIVESEVEVRNYVSIWVGKNAKLKLGQNVFINNFCSLNCLKSIEIGENTLFGEGVKIYDHNHLYERNAETLSVNRKEFSFGEVKIGKYCWLGSNVVVLKGVEIGDNSIIGAGCVIHKNVPSNSLIVHQQDIVSK